MSGPNRAKRRWLLVCAANMVRWHESVRVVSAHRFVTLPVWVRHDLLRKDLVRRLHGADAYEVLP